MRRVVAPGGGIRPRDGTIGSRRLGRAVESGVAAVEPAVLRAMLLDAGFAEATVEEGDDGPQVAVARA